MDPPQPLPAHAEELARIIDQHVTTALAQRNDGRGQQNGCSFKTFQTCNPKTFSGIEGPLSIIRWIERMESVMNTSGCTPEQRVKYAVCSFIDEALTWWNTHIQNVGETAAYEFT